MPIEDNPSNNLFKSWLTETVFTDETILLHCNRRHPITYANYDDLSLLLLASSGKSLQ